MKVHKTRLAARVSARNAVGAQINDRVPAMFAALQQFVGRKVCKAGGTLLEKVKRALPKCANPKELHFWYSTGHGYSITVTFKTCEGSEEHGYTGAHYAEDTVYLASLTDGVLEKLHPWGDSEQRKTNWTEDQVVKAREQVRKAEQQLSQARQALGEFGMHDN